MSVDRKIAVNFDFMMIRLHLEFTYRREDTPLAFTISSLSDVTEDGGLDLEISLGYDGTHRDAHNQFLNLRSSLHSEGSGK